MFRYKYVDISLILGLALSSLLLGYAVSNIFQGILIVIGMFFIYKNKRYTFHKYLFPLILFYIYEACSLFWSLNKEETIHNLVLQLPIFILPFFLSQYPYIQKEKVIRIFSFSLVLYFLVCLIRSLVIFVKEGDYDIFYYHSLVGLFKNHAIYIALYCAFCLLTLVNFKKHRNYDYLLITGLVIFLVFLASKNIIISTIFIQIILFFIKKTNKNLKKISFLFLFFVFLGIGFFNNPLKVRFLEEFKNLEFSYIFHSDNFENYYWTGTNLRLLQLRIGYEISHNNHAEMLGIGLGAAQEFIDQYYVDYDCPQYKGYNFHNQYMQSFIEIGAIGEILLLGIIGFLFFQMYKTRSLLILIFTLLITLLFFTEVLFVRQKGILFFVITYIFIFKINAIDRGKLDSNS